MATQLVANPLQRCVPSARGTVMSWLARHRWWWWCCPSLAPFEPHVSLRVVFWGMQASLHVAKETCSRILASSAATTPGNTTTSDSAPHAVGEAVTSAFLAHQALCTQVYTENTLKPVLELKKKLEEEAGVDDLGVREHTAASRLGSVYGLSLGTVCNMVAHWFRRRLGRCHTRTRVEPQQRWQS